jgi:4-hydroxy-tetrahydrodipicolinate reductase
MIHLAINGGLGKMGQRVHALAKDTIDMHVMRLFEYPQHPQLGQTVGGAEVSGDKAALNNIDVVVDFSLPESAIEMLGFCEKAGVPVIVGPTGFSEEQAELVKAASSHIPVVFSPNMSVSVNMLFKVLDDICGVFSGYDVIVSEAHHVHKKDAPSGTAKKLVDIINEHGFNVEYDDVRAVRKGEIVGDHTVVFENDFDRFEIRHHAKTRDIFAVGALHAARWIVGKPAGLYSMRDVLSA